MVGGKWQIQLERPLKKRPEYYTYTKSKIFKSVNFLILILILYMKSTSSQKKKQNLFFYCKWVWKIAAVSAFGLVSLFKLKLIKSNGWSWKRILFITWSFSVVLNSVSDWPIKNQIGITIENVSL
jgi:hypothetical protein